VITEEDIQAAVDRSKGEIRADIASGLVPATVRSFSDLHDYVDANEYGGLTETPFYDNSEDNWIEAANKVQDIVDTWLRGGMTE
jgi:hypothetical protein